MRVGGITWMIVGAASIAGCATASSRQVESTAEPTPAASVVSRTSQDSGAEKGDVIAGGQRSSATTSSESGLRLVKQASAEADSDATGGIALEAGRQPVPINLATALKLSSASPIDVQVAAERIRGAFAQLDLAKAAWLPTVTFGGDYNRHDGPIQDVTGQIVNADRSSMMLGMGSGIGSAAVLSPNDAIFGPLAAKQIIAARNADAQAASNNSMVAVTDAYFAVEQARGELAGARDATRRAQDVVARVQKLSSGLVSPLEVTRAEAHLARRQAAESSAVERWQVASAELSRLLRLDSRDPLEPLEPPELQIRLVDDEETVDELVAIGLTHRPELAANQAQVQATLTLLRQEKMRPLIPSVLLRGASTPVTGTLGAGFFGGGTNGNIGNAGLRDDFDLQFLWQLDNLGFGNAARIRGRESELRAATLELFRIQDRIAAEVAQAHAQSKQAHRRVALSETEARLALESYEKNLEGLGQIRRSGDLVQSIVRPQEVVAAVQDLAQAYYNYYGAVADSNRAQFRLYRALGRPAAVAEADANIAPSDGAPSPLPPHQDEPLTAPPEKSSREKSPIP